MNTHDALWLRLEGHWPLMLSPNTWHKTVHACQCPVLICVHCGAELCPEHGLIRSLLTYEKWSEAPDYNKWKLLVLEEHR